MRRLAILAAAALAFAGCASPESTLSTSDTSTAPPATLFRWSETWQDGELTVLTAVNPMAGVDPQAFTVPAKASRVWFNLTVTAQPSPEVQVRFIEPDCNRDCVHDVRATGGQVNYDLVDPPSGEWGLSFFGDPTPARGTYHLSVNAFVPA